MKRETSPLNYSEVFLRSLSVPELELIRANIRPIDVHRNRVGWSLGEDAQKELGLAIGVVGARYDDVVAGWYAALIGHLALVYVGPSGADALEVARVDLLARTRLEDAHVDALVYAEHAQLDELFGGLAVHLHALLTCVFLHESANQHAVVGAWCCVCETYQILRLLMFSNS